MYPYGYQQTTYGYPTAYSAPSQVNQYQTQYPVQYPVQTTTLQGYQTSYQTGYQTGYPMGAYSYSSAYDPRMPFLAPMGISPIMASKMMEASQIFRMFDRDHNGFLDKEEWKRAMYQLSMSNNRIDAKRLFYMADQDLSNRISEREFCEFWLKANPY